MTQVLKSLAEITADYSIFEQDQVLTASQLNSVTDYLNDQTRLMRVNLLGVGVASGLRVSVQNETVKITKGIGITTDGDLLYYSTDVVCDRFRRYDLSSFKYEYAPFHVNGTMIAVYELIAKDVRDERTDIVPLSEFSFQEAKSLESLVAVLLMESYVNDPDICTGTDCDNLGQDCRNAARLLLIDKTSVSGLLKPTIATDSEAYNKLNAITADRPLIPATLRSLSELAQLYRESCTRIYTKLLIELDKIYPNCAAFLNDTSSFISGGSEATAIATVSGGAVTAIALTSGIGYTSTPDVVITGGGGTGATAIASLTPGAVDAIQVTSGGIGYTSAPDVAITGGGGTGATAIAILANRSVNSISVAAGGTGYTAAPTVAITGGGGTGATAIAALAGRAISSIGVMTGGTGYNSPPTVAITGGGGSGATATATLAPGIVSTLTLTASGTGYTSPPTVTIAPVAGQGGSGAAATATLAPGVVGSISVRTGGSGYNAVPTVTITGGGGSGATAVATVAGGVVTGIRLTAAGTGYTSTPTVAIAPAAGQGGSGATAAATLAGRAVGSISLTAAGTGYTSPPTVTITPVAGQGGSGATATATLAGRAVESITLTANGTGYTSAPTVTLTPVTGDRGSGATAIATLAPGAVGTISVINGGTGYTSTPTVSLTGGDGSGATANATLTPATVESIRITNAGTGYTSTPTVTLTGGSGTGAAAIASLTPASVSHVSVTNGGTGYTSAPTISFTGGGGTGATATATVSNGAVTAIATTSGTGYTSAPAISFTGGGGTGATATATISGGAVTAIAIASGGTGYTSAPAIAFLGGVLATGTVSTADWKTKLTELQNAARSDTGIQYYYDFLKDLVETYNQFRDLLFGDTTWSCPDINWFPKHLLLGNLSPSPDPNENRTVFYPSPLVSRTAESLNHAKFLLQKLDRLLEAFQIPAARTNTPIRVTPSQFEDQPLSERAIPYYYPVNPANSIHTTWNYRLHQRGMDVYNYSYNASAYGAKGGAAQPFASQIGNVSFFRIEGHLGQKLETVFNALSEQIRAHNLPFSVLAVKLEEPNQFGSLHFKDLLAQYPGVEHFAGVIWGGTFVVLADASTDIVVADFMLPHTLYQPSGSICTLHVKPSDNLVRVLSAIADGQDAHICFQQGTYTLPARLILQKKGHLTISGSGKGTRITAPGIESVLEFSNCKSVSISNCYLENAATQATIPTGFANNLEDLRGVLTLINCPSVELNQLSLRCAHQVVRSASCITVRQDLPLTNTQVRIRHCDLEVGYQQVGILLVNVERSQLEDNKIQVDTGNAPITLRTLSSNPTYRLRLLPRLLANAYLGGSRPRGTGATSTRFDECNVQLTHAGQSIRFKSDLPTAAWQALITAQNPFVRTRQEFLSAVKRLARQILVDDNFRTDRSVPSRSAFNNWYQSASGQNIIIASQGIAIVGSRAQDIRILNNSIRDCLQGIHIGISPRTNHRAGSVLLMGNRIEIVVPSDQIRERHGIYVSSCESLIIENNYLAVTRKSPLPIEGMRISGRLGRMVIIRHNHLIGFIPHAIYFNPLDADPGPEQVQWLVANNMASGTSRFMRIATNRPPADEARIIAKVQNSNNFP